MNTYRIWYKLPDDETEYAVLVEAATAWGAQDDFYKFLPEYNPAEIEVLKVEKL